MAEQLTFQNTCGEFIAVYRRKLHISFVAQITDSPSNQILLKEANTAFVLLCRIVTQK